VGVDPDYQGKGNRQGAAKAFIDVCEVSRIPSRLIIPRNEHFEKMLLALGFEQGQLADTSERSSDSAAKVYGRRGGGAK